MPAESGAFGCSEMGVATGIEGRTGGPEEPVRFRGGILNYPSSPTLRWLASTMLTYPQVVEITLGGLREESSSVIRWRNGLKLRSYLRIDEAVCETITRVDAADGTTVPPLASHHV